MSFSGPALTGTRHIRHAESDAPCRNGFAQTGQIGHNGHMATMTVAEAKNNFSDVLRRAEYGGERVVVERHGKPVAAIVSTDDLRQLEAAENAVDLRDARAALAEAKERGTIPLDTVLRKHGLAHLLVQQESPVRRPPRAEKGRPAVKRTRKPSRNQRQR